MKKDRLEHLPRVNYRIGLIAGSEFTTDRALFCDGYCLCGALNLACAADDACVVVDDYGFLTVVAFEFL